MKTIEQEKRTITRWLGDATNRELLHDRPVVELERISERGVERLADVSSPLWKLSVWLTNQGAGEALSGLLDDAGSNYLAGLKCEYWAYKVRAAVNSANRKRNPKLSFRTVAICMLSMLSLDQFEYAKDLAMMARKHPLDELFFQPITSEVGLLAEGLVSSFLQWTPCLPKVERSEYASLLDEWACTDLEVFERVVEAAIEAHVSLSEGADDAEFDRVVFKVFPVEVGAVRAMRRRRGLPWVDVPHVLSGSPLLAMRPTRGGAHSELIQSVVKRVAPLVGESAIGAEA